MIHHVLPSEPLKLRKTAFPASCWEAQTAEAKSSPHSAKVPPASSHLSDCGILRISAPPSPTLIRVLLLCFQLLFRLLSECSHVAFANRQRGGWSSWLLQSPSPQSVFIFPVCSHAARFGSPSPPRWSSQRQRWMPSRQWRHMSNDKERKDEVRSREEHCVDPFFLHHLSEM